MSLDKLKSTNNLDKLYAVKEDNKDPSEKKSYVDRLWKPELDTSGNGYAVIRFPRLKVKTLSVKLFSHAFQAYWSMVY